MNEQLSVVRIEVVFDSGIFSYDLSKRCCVEGNRNGPKTKPLGTPSFNLNEFKRLEPILTD